MSQLNLLPPQIKKEELKLRPYQKEAIASIYQRYKAGCKSVLFVGATGCGKTAIASKIIADAVSRDCRVLFICHRGKLVKQTQATLLKFFGIESGIVWAENPTNYSLSVQIGMIQTLQNRTLPQDIGLVVFDEAHTVGHFGATERILDHYSGGILCLSPCKFLGLTATPWRSKSKEGFCHLFDGLVHNFDPCDLVKQGFLARPRIFGYNGLIDFSQLDGGSNGDYTTASMQAQCDEEYDSEVVEKFLEMCPDRKAIAFCSGKKQALDLAKQFNEQGIISEVVVGETTETEREAIYARLKTGETQLVSSVGVLCEGFDETSINCVLIARPTRSKALLIQMSGRGLRLHPGKEDCFVLDFGECFQRLKIHLSDRLPVSLCPSPQNPIELTKQCSNCNAMIPIFARICPECGEVFEGGEPDKPEGDPPIFGELLSPEQREQCCYFVKQRKTAYSKQRNPYKASWLFYQRYGYFPPKEWYKHSCLRDIHKTSELAKRKFIHFLRKVSPKAHNNWIKEQVALEFGQELSIETENWWSYFRISPNCNFGEVKARYQDFWERLEKDPTANNENYQLLGFYFDLARAALK